MLNWTPTPFLLESSQRTGFSCGLNPTPIQRIKPAAGTTNQNYTRELDGVKMLGHTKYTPKYEKIRKLRHLKDELRN
jgi:hypothetical protein